VVYKYISFKYKNRLNTGH